MVRDYAMVAALVWGALTFIPTIEDSTLRAAAWIVYGFVQGLVCTGVWILGHEAGHGAFSKHERLNNIVGWVTHSSLMVPYFSWKFSHHRHHMYTGHMEKDMAFVPKTKDAYLTRTLAKLEMFEDTPIYHLVSLFLHQLFGWPMYLIFNATAGPGSLQDSKVGAWGRSHFAPWSGVFRKSEAPYIAISDIGLGLVLYGLYLVSGVVGVKTTILLYLQPYLWVHHWLVAITYLHHTDEDVPHYDPQSWTFVKGALATVDREFGFTGKHLFHGIIEFHVVHHLFP